MKNELTIEYREYDFVNWTTRPRRAVIDVDEVVKHNAFLQRSMKDGEMTEWQPIETAPKDRRILGYGIVALEREPGAATVRWDDHYKRWYCDPNEASEYDPEICELTHWALIPEPPK